MKQKFSVYRSPSVTYVRIMMVVMVFLAFWLAYKTRIPWMYVIALPAIVTTAQIYALFDASVTVSETGLCHRSKGKQTILTWNEIAFVRTAVLTPMGYSGPVRLYLFSSHPINLHAIETSKTLPQASQDLIFVTDQPHLMEALQKYIPAEKQKYLITQEGR